MPKIYIISPTSIATGGTELLQQLCYILNKNSIVATMFYTETFYGSAVEKVFDEYQNPYVEQLQDNEDNILVVPETHIDVAKQYVKSMKYFWWLSVDNYYGSGKKRFDAIHSIYYAIKDITNKKMFNNSIHLVQSKYASDYLELEKNILPSKIYYLSDYLNCKYLNESTYVSQNRRTNRVLYNPRKGFSFTSKIIQATENEFEWFPLQGLTKDQMIEVMETSKVYIDFGNHPGKDRIPREAAISGCCIITGKRGAAQNSDDIPIPDSYKFDDDVKQIKLIVAKIHECIDEFEVCKSDFDEYRNKILQEKEVFEKSAIKIFGKYKR